MSSVSETRASPIQSVERAAAILIAVGDQRGTTVGDLAVLLGVHKSTASRLVATLASTGLIRGGVDGRLRLGPELGRLGRLAAGGADLAEIARVPLDDLAARSGETVTLAVREGNHAVTIAESRGTHRVAARSWVGARTPLASTADGKALLAFGDLPADATRALRTELARVRENEWASARGEIEENLYGVAAPVWAADGTCLGAVCLSGPSYRVTPDRFEPLAEQCRRAAYEISDLHHEQREHLS